MAEADATQDKTKVGAFAVVNASELVERLAYYGVLSVNALFLAELGTSPVVIGLLSSIFIAVPYVVPMLIGPVADRRGYKDIMLLAFLAYAAGFLLLGAWPVPAGLVLGAFLVATGAGMFKPLTAATVALVTATRHRTLGYSIYYTGINVGGFIGPIVMAALGHYRTAYFVGAVVIALDFLLILALFREPGERKPAAATFMETLQPLREVLANRRFLVLLAIFSGFWFLYSMALTFIITYLQAFVERPDWFPPSYQIALESLCVIALGVPLGAFANRRDGVRMMALGIALVCAGFALVGFLPWFGAYVAGVLLIAAGEVLAYPGFFAYVSRIAPRDRIAVYQSYGFLPLFVGFLVGPIVGGVLYRELVSIARRPTLFWALMDLVGVLTLAALLLYDRSTRKAAAANDETAPRPVWWKGRLAAVAVLLLGVALVLAGAAAGSRVPLAPGSGTAASGHGPALDPGTPIATLDGQAAEGEDVVRPVTVPAGAGNVTFTLTWQDEAAASPLPGATNQPDRFELAVGDHKQAASNEPGGDGQLVLRLALPAGTTNATITLLSAGDTVFGGQTVAADTGNAWTLDVTAA